VQPEERLDEERVRDQRDDAARVARGVEAIRIACGLRAGEPRLQQRRAGRQREERQADALEQQREQCSRRRQTTHHRGRGTRREECSRDDHDGSVDRNLAP